MKQNKESLGTYLKDHYAGGVGAIGLIEHLSQMKESKLPKEFLQKLLVDVRSDHEALRRIMKAVEVEESTIRNAGAWIAEKIGRAKLGSGSDEDSLPDLQALEALYMGITGKRLLWRALAKVNGKHHFPEQIDFTALEERALQQLDQVETKRLELASMALS